MASRPSRPKMCPSCGKLMGVDRVCPYCGKDSGSIGGRVSALATRSSRGPVVTFGLVVVNLALYLLAMLLGGQEVADEGFEVLKPDTAVMLTLGLQSPELVAMGEWWRLVMPIFLHLGLLHLLMNTLVLWLTGRVLEQDIGGWAFFAMYMASGILGFVASQIAGIGGGGASGAVAGVLGCTLVYRRMVDGSFSHPVTHMAIQLIVLNAIFGLAMSGVNNTAHLFGLLTGAAMGFVIARQEGRRFMARVWVVLASGFGALTVAALVMTILNQPPRWLPELVSAVRCHDVAVGALNQRLQTIEPGPAMAALQCFERVGPADVEVDTLVSDLRAAVARMRYGRVDGSRRAEMEGLEAFSNASRRLMKLLERDKTRYWVDVMMLLESARAQRLR